MEPPAAKSRVVVPVATWSVVFEWLEKASQSLVGISLSILSKKRNGGVGFGLLYGGWVRVFGRKTMKDAPVYVL